MASLPLILGVPVVAGFVLGYCKGVKKYPGTGSRMLVGLFYAGGGALLLAGALFGACINLSN